MYNERFNSTLLLIFVQIKFSCIVNLTQTGHPNPNLTQTEQNSAPPKIHSHLSEMWSRIEVKE